MVVDYSKNIVKEVSKAFIGNDEMIRRVLMSIYAGGHVLLEDCPGVGKTTLALAFSKVLGLDYNRVQFTTDTMPSDITGYSIYNRKSESFEYHEGAANCQLLLADEINRTSPKTQAALLEVMEERAVTVDGKRHELPAPFICIATQNPYGSYGTQPLPESQLDRFMVKLSIGYPTHSNQMKIIKAQRYNNLLDEVEQVIDGQNLLEIQNFLSSINMTDELLGYAVELCEATRKEEMLERGVSPRGVIALVRMSRAHAMVNERSYVEPEDIQAVYKDVCSHRVQLRPQARIEGIDEKQILDNILDRVKPPQISKEWANV